MKDFTSAALRIGEALMSQEISGANPLYKSTVATLLGSCERKEFNEVWLKSQTYAGLATCRW